MDPPHGGGFPENRNLGDKGCGFRRQYTAFAAYGTPVRTDEKKV